MLRPLLIAASTLLISATAANPVRVPVLVELFTSEGCSSCPPADRLLQQLDPQAVVLSEHVDYWDHLGWKDRFSSHDFTARQEMYAREFAIDGPYTPQMIVDGAVELNGSDGRRAGLEIAQESAKAKATIRLARAGSGVQVDITDTPNGGDVMLAVADNTAVTEVKAGENKGHELRHVAVVRTLRKIGTIRRGEYFSTRVDLPPTAMEQRIVVFLQLAGQGRVIGAAILPAGGV